MPDADALDRLLVDMGSNGCVRSRAWIWLFSSTHFDHPEHSNDFAERSEALCRVHDLAARAAS